MKIFALPFYYVAWHYTRGVVNVWQTFTNILWFLNSFFSFAILFKTLFSPWQRLREGYDRRRGLGDMLGSLLVNILMRIFGFIIRLITIIVGAIIYLIVFVTGLVFVVLWFFIPPFMVFLFIAGILAIIMNGKFDIPDTVI